MMFAPHWLRERRYRRWETDCVALIRKCVPGEQGEKLAAEFLGFPVPEFCRVRLEAQLGLVAAIEAGVSGGGAQQVFAEKMTALEAEYFV